MGKLDDNYLVYTNYDKKADFKVPTFYLAPQILVISDSKGTGISPEGEGAEQILAAYTDLMEARGYAAAADQEALILVSGELHRKYLLFHQLHNLNGGGVIPDIGGRTTGGGNWGGGWYYPYAVTYSYSTNSFLTEMVNLKAEQGETAKSCPIVWTSYLTGFETGSKAINRTLAVEAVNQSFAQSPYLTNK